MHENHASRAEALSAPGDRSPMIAICGATDRDLAGGFLIGAGDQISAGGFPCHIALGEFRLQHTHHRISTAQRLEGSEAEACGFILVMHAGNAGGGRDFGQGDQGCWRIARPGGDFRLGAGIAAFGKDRDARHAMAAVQ